MLIQFDLGDFSDDGHGKVEALLVESSHDAEAIAAAYQKAVEETGFTLHDRVADAYEDRYLHRADYEALERIGYDFQYSGLHPEDTLNARQLLDIFLFMVRLGNPEISIVPAEVEVFFQCGREGRYFGLGYGLFE